jgi:hypothetical protein
MAEIVACLPDEIAMPALEYPGFVELLEVDSIPNPALKAAINKRTDKTANN